MKMIDQLVERMSGKNLSDIARRAGVARDHVTDISRGRVQNMKVVTYEKLSSALDDIEYGIRNRSCQKCKVPFRIDQDHCGLCGEREHAAS